MSKHIGRSRHMMEHARALKKQICVQPTWYDCFKEAHVRRDGSYIDERSRHTGIVEVQRRIVRWRQLVICMTSIRFIWAVEVGPLLLTRLYFWPFHPKGVIRAYLHPHMQRTNTSDIGLRS